MTDEFIDHKARQTAELASQRISDHEDRCGERWAEARKASDATNSAVSRIHTRIDKVLWIGLAACAGIIGQIFLHFIGAK